MKTYVWERTYANIDVKKKIKKKAAKYISFVTHEMNVYYF